MDEFCFSYVLEIVEFGSFFLLLDFWATSNDIWMSWSHFTNFYSLLCFVYGSRSLLWLSIFLGFFGPMIQFCLLIIKRGLDRIGSTKKVCFFMFHKVSNSHRALLVLCSKIFLITSPFKDFFLKGFENSDEKNNGNW